MRCVGAGKRLSLELIAAGHLRILWLSFFAALPRLNATYVLLEIARDVHDEERRACLPQLLESGPFRIAPYALTGQHCGQNHRNVIRQLEDQFVGDCLDGLDRLDELRRPELRERESDVVDGVDIEKTP